MKSAVRAADERRATLEGFLLARKRRSDVTCDIETMLWFFGRRTSRVAQSIAH